MTFIKFKVHLTKVVDQATLDKLREAEKALADIRGSVEKAFLDSDHGKGALAIATNEYSRSTLSLSWDERSQLVGTMQVNEDYEATRAFQPPLNLGEKTINALLSGRLLSDAEKKALLKKIGVDLSELTSAETAPAA